MQFTITITDAEQLRGIAAATAAFNDANQDTLTDDEYLAMVVNGAADSYAKSYPASETKEGAIAAKVLAESRLAAKEADVTRLETEKAALVAENTTLKAASAEVVKP